MSDTTTTKTGESEQAAARTNKTKQAPAAPKKPEKLLVNPPINWPIHWFERGDPNEKPYPGTVMDTFGRDMISICVKASRNGRFERYISACPHMSDPAITARKRSIPGKPIGAWDFIPGLVPEEYANLDATRYRIVRLFQEHAYNVYQIASALGAGWSVEKVQKILDDYATSPGV